MNYTRLLYILFLIILNNINELCSQTLVGRYLANIATHSPHELQLLKIQIEVGCYGISRRFFFKTKWMILTMMALFNILLAYDMMGDSDDDQIWPLILYSLFPVPLFIVYQLFRVRHKIFDYIQSWCMFVGRSSSVAHSTDKTSLLNKKQNVKFDDVAFRQKRGFTNGD